MKPFVNLPAVPKSNASLDHADAEIVDVSTARLERAYTSSTTPKAPVDRRSDARIAWDAYRTVACLRADAGAARLDIVA